MAMKKGVVIAVMLIVAAGLFTSARAWAGSLDAPAAPTNTASAMWTLENIYNVLDTRTTNVNKRTVVFTEPTNGPTNGTMHTLNDIMRLVTNRAPVPRTGHTNTYAVGDDGNLKKGVAWPNPRFSPVATSGAETNQIKDNLTGLIWARNANIASNSVFAAQGLVVGWSNAFDVILSSTGLVNAVNYGTTNDWRLPNALELLSLIAWNYGPALSDGTGTNQWTEARGPFTGVRMANYWTSTTVGGNAWFVGLTAGGGMGGNNKTTGSGYVWPVRGGQ